MQTNPRQGRIHFRANHNPYPMEMIQQAYPALEMLNLFGGLTSWQVAKLLFLGHPNSQGQPRNESAARKAANHYCLRRLKDLGLVAVKPIIRVDHPLTKWEINHLTAKGHEVLKVHREDHGLETPPYRHPRNLTYQTINPHAMAIKDVAISALASAHRNHLEVVVWLDDLEIRSLHKSGQLHWPMEPDGVLLMRYGQIERVFFIEVDRGTESVASPRANSWSTKMGKYREYFAAQRLSDPWLKDYPQPDVMVVAPSERRLESLRKTTGDAGGRSAYWFTTTELLEPPYSFLGQVWQRIGLPDYYSPTERFTS